MIIRNKSGLELLIHIGLDTINLNGKLGFELHVSVGDKILWTNFSYF